VKPEERAIPGRVRTGLDGRDSEWTEGPSSRSLSSLTIDPSRSSALTDSRNSNGLRFRATASSSMLKGDCRNLSRMRAAISMSRPLYRKKSPTAASIRNRRLGNMPNTPRRLPRISKESYPNRMDGNSARRFTLNWHEYQKAPAAVRRAPVEGGLRGTEEEASRRGAGAGDCGVDRRA
jgi:hypothetical protein